MISVTYSPSSPSCLPLPSLPLPAWLHLLLNLFIMWQILLAGCTKKETTGQFWPMDWWVVYLTLLWNLPECSKCIQCIQFSSVQFSRSVVSDSLRPRELQHARPPCPSPTPRIYSNSCPSSRWCHPAISSSVIPSPPASNPSQHQSLFQWVNSSHEVAKVLESQLQHQSCQWTPRTDLL